MNGLLDLYLTFARIGCVTFGGGYAMLPILERELVDKRGWTNMDDLRDYFSIGQCTPGIIALNVSTFIGEKKAGIPGALCSTTGFLTGPIAIILVIAAFLKNFASYAIVQHAFAGIRVCVCVLIVQAVLRLWKKSVIDAFTLGLYLVIFALNAFTGVLPFHIPAAVLVIIAGALGIAVSLYKEYKKTGGSLGTAPGSKIPGAAKTEEIKAAEKNNAAEGSTDHGEIKTAEVSESIKGGDRK
ncbi:MAG: chromate transporter [Parasporobacterium sp.]|nr:chromate transporter [Parasporobacterium sp.]